MKKTAIMAALLLGSAAASSLLAQGTISWGNAVGTTFLAPIYGVDPNNRTQTRTGNTSAGRPAGTQTYGGALLTGTGFTLAIYVGGSASEAMASMSALGTATFRTGTAAGFIFQQTATDPNHPAGTTGINVQFRAWDNSGGHDTWASVLQAGGSQAGAVSDVFTVGPLGGIDPNGNVVFPPQTTGLRSFQLTAVPEPSIIALGALGLGALLLRRRK